MRSDDSRSGLISAIGTAGISSLTTYWSMRAQHGAWFAPISFRQRST